MLALDSDVCPTPVTHPVAPLNTYPFLKKPQIMREVRTSAGPKYSREARGKILGLTKSQPN